MRFFTSDHHLCHNNILPYTGRPWSDVEDMNTGLLERWNAVVGPDDHVVILGDLTLKNPAPNGVPAPWLKEWLTAANGTKTLYPGNHDKAWGKPDLNRWVDLYGQLGIDGVQVSGTTVIAGRVVGLSHLPRTVTGHEQVQAWEYRRSIPFPDDDKIWRLHGHVHRQWLQHGREINVGVDAWDGFPVSETAITGLILTGPGDEDVRSWAA